MERPGLKQLRADIRSDLIDVVVEKVDRLTRSLTDFARIIEAFDAEARSSFARPSRLTQRPAWGASPSTSRASSALLILPDAGRSATH